MNDISSALYPWFAIQVKSRTEKSVAQALAGKGYSVFLPVRNCRRRWSDRQTILEVPVFPGYLFCRLDVERRLPILITEGVLRIVGCGRVPVAISEAEIESIQRIVSGPLNYDQCPYLAAGQAVRLTSGPLAGLEGILIRTSKQCRLIISVPILQRSIAVEVDMDMVEVIPPLHKPPVLTHNGAQPRASAFVNLAPV